MNKIFSVNKIIRATLVAIFALLLWEPCNLYYEYHFCPGILHLYEIPDELLVAAAIACLWGIVSTILTKRLDRIYWIRVGIVLVVYFVAIFLYC